MISKREFNEYIKEPEAAERDYASILGDRVPFFDGYENAGICHYTEFQKKNSERTYRFSEIEGKHIEGIPICVTRGEDGELLVTFCENTHAIAVGATRSGKTTGFVIPLLNIAPLKKNKPSFVVSDPKGELYTATASRFREQGYDVKVLNFLDHKHSDCWNPLTKIFREYQKIFELDKEVGVVKIGDEYYNEFRGKIYEDQRELDEDIKEERDVIITHVDNLIISIAEHIAPIKKQDDPYWDQMASMLVQGFLWAMLEDSDPDSENPITEDTYSFNTMLNIFDSFENGDDRIEDGGYFGDRDPKVSKAHQLVYNSVITLRAKITRGCIISCFLCDMKKFRDAITRRITTANTINIEKLDGDRPVIIYIAYKDEDSLNYDTIGLFLTDLYTGLINTARKKGGMLSREFLFLLDEFGNFPCFGSFENVISACGSRNIWFLLIVQSYAQLYRVYGEDTAKIIIDNLNMRMFFGSGNYDTKKAFSDACGQHVIFSPMSVINGSEDHIDRYGYDQVPLVPVSRLGELEVGECIINRMVGDVILSKIERSYLCPEYENAKTLELPTCPIKFSDPRFVYYYQRKKKEED